MRISRIILHTAQGINQTPFLYVKETFLLPDNLICYVVVSGPNSQSNNIERHISWQERIIFYAKWYNVSDEIFYSFWFADNSAWFVLQPVSSTINTLAGALYKVFCASPDPARQEMRDACFDYLSLGGICSYGPVSLLSGLNPRPMHLFLHFFAVAVYGVGRLMIPFPTPQRMWLGTRLILVCPLIFPVFSHHQHAC